MSKLRLGVNIDHVATLRQARYTEALQSLNCEPNMIAAAAACERAGAHGITVHLRADRRHVQDQDVYRLRESIDTKLNLEMGNTADILEIALRVLPEDVCLVPENRREVTTEGGLDAAGQIEALRPAIERLQEAAIRVSLFIEPDFKQIDAAVSLGAEAVELHTGAFSNAVDAAQLGELQRIREAAEYANANGLQVNAGHGINYTNIALIREVAHLAELNIGHTIVARSIFVGLEAAVAEMLSAMKG